MFMAAAQAQRLSAMQAHYKGAHSDGSAFQTYQIEMPIVGRYAAIRGFAEDVLLALPFAALEDVRFKRDSLAQAQVQATLRFVLYLDLSMPLSPQSSPAAEVRS